MAPGRFLLALIDGGGTVPPALGVAAALVDRGHFVRVLADPTVEASARAAGCDFTPWRLAPHFTSLTEQTAMIAELEGRNPYRSFKAVKERVMSGPAGSFAEDVVDTVEQHPVEALLV